MHAQILKAQEIYIRLEELSHKKASLWSFYSVIFNGKFVCPKFDLDIHAKCVTRFVKRDLPHTFNSTDLEDHILVVKKHITPSTKLCGCSLLTEFQVNSLLQGRRREN